jgi:GTP-binding protein EngB required for normal cell division
MEFTKKDKVKLERAFKKYTKEQLKDFISRAIAERLLLAISLNNKDGLDEDRKLMIQMLGELQEKAGDELKRRG